MKGATPAIRDRLHDGIDDADYVTTVKVLQQKIRNTGGVERAMGRPPRYPMAVRSVDRRR